MPRRSCGASPGVASSIRSTGRWRSWAKPSRRSSQKHRGLAEATLEAYARALQQYLAFCAGHQVEPERATREHIAAYVNHLWAAPRLRGTKGAHAEPGLGLSQATIQQRLVALRLVYDYLVEEGRRLSNPVGRGHGAVGEGFGTPHQRGLVPRCTRLPWIPTDDQWQAILQAVRQEPIRNRVMLALAYDAGLRREELCSLRTDDFDPAYRTLRIRSETTKGRRERVVAYSAVTGVLLQAYLTHRQSLSRARGPLFLSKSPRNRAEPITLWTWSKVVRRMALSADVPQFTTHTLRHLCLTDLARSGWELHALATFAGHRNLSTTLQYIHLSGRDLADKLARGMAQIHHWRIETLALDAQEGESV